MGNPKLQENDRENSYARGSLYPGYFLFRGDKLAFSIPPSALVFGVQLHTSGGKMAWNVCILFWWYIEIFKVYRAARWIRVFFFAVFKNTCVRGSNWGFHAPPGQTLQRGILKLCEKMNTIVGYVLFVAVVHTGSTGVQKWPRPQKVTYLNYFPGISAYGEQIGAC